MGMQYIAEKTHPHYLPVDLARVDPCFTRCLLRLAVSPIKSGRDPRKERCDLPGATRELQVL